METSPTIGNIAAAFAKAQGEFSNPPKNKEVEVQPRQRDDGKWPPKYKFKYATFDAILDMARPALAKHEIAMIQAVGANGSMVTVTTRIIHSSGEWIESTIAGTVDAKGLQSLGAAVSYLKRYALTAMLGIAADEDDDGNGADGNLTDAHDRAAPAKKSPPPSSSKPTTPFDDPTKSTPFIPVPVDAEGSGSDWKEWGNRFAEAVNLAETWEQIDTITIANHASLETLKTEKPKWHDSLSGLVASRMTALKTGNVI
jgi:hypothetical protein